MVKLAARSVVLLCALAIPALVAYAGVRLLALELESRQPDGDLEAGGYFAIAVLLVGLVLVAYLVSGFSVLALWRWVSGRPVAILGTVTLASLMVVIVGVALSLR